MPSEIVIDEEEHNVPTSLCLLQFKLLEIRPYFLQSNEVKVPLHCQKVILGKSIPLHYKVP